MIRYYRTARETWTPTVIELRPSVARVNEDTSDQILRGMTAAELQAHIHALDAEHRIKRAALQSAADALARALNEKWRRAHV